MRGPESRHTQTPGLRWISLLLRLAFFATSVALMAMACKVLNPVPLYTKDGQLVQTRTAWYNFLTGILAAMCAITADVFEVVGLFFYVMKIFPGNALIMDLASIGSCIASFILLQPPHSTNEFDVFTTDFNAPDFVKKSTLIGLSAAVLAERVIAMILSFVWYRKNGTEKQEHVSHLQGAVSEYDKPTTNH